MVHGIIDTREAPAEHSKLGHPVFMSTLIIPDARKSDEGKYICQASPKYLSKPAQLHLTRGET